jgi:hypothetical protein
LGSSLLGSALHASIAVDRIRIAEVRDWRTPISPGTILDLRQIAEALTEQCGHKTFQTSWFWADDGLPEPYTPFADPHHPDGAEVRS